MRKKDVIFWKREYKKNREKSNFGNQESILYEDYILDKIDELKRLEKIKLKILKLERDADNTNNMKKAARLDFEVMKLKEELRVLK